MAATYDDTLPTDKDKARSLLGDTDVDPASEALHSDEHITAVLAWQGSLAAGVVYLAKELIARFATEPVKVTADGVTVDYTARLGVWRTIVAEQQAEVSGGGISFVTATFGASTSTDEYARLGEYFP